MRFTIALFIALILVAHALTALSLVSRPNLLVHALPTNVLTFAILTTLIVMFAAYGNSTVWDRAFYTYDVIRVHDVSLPQLFDERQFSTGAGDESPYLLFIWMVSQIGTSTRTFYLSVVAVCLSVYLYALKRKFHLLEINYILLLTISFSVFTSYTSLVARQGISMSLIFAGVATYAFGARRSIVSIGLLTLGTLVHWSALPFTLAAIAARWTQLTLKRTLSIWGASVMAFLFQAQTSLLGPLVKFVPKFDEYTSASLSGVYASGTNRIDFLALSALYLAAALAFRQWLLLPAWYDLILKTYVLMNSLFLLFGFVYYSDRLVAYSWFLAPVLLSAPAFAQPSAKRIPFGLLILGGSLVMGFTIGPWAEIAKIVSHHS
ncbi:EpsG family protein [Knoellia sp. p5-6-4]|uniref:EpsG family protein n=1 Tax=unclassified Knoellia TaxID=2618719 RepID=UPI0023DBA2F4|nr:EpsG family protein [Knoellia sp. p5-6-4]MDF2144156.1 EpsG family protein [Knoellia sp. p5-6-4]